MINQLARRFGAVSIRTKLFILSSVILISSFAVFGYQESRMLTKVIEGEALVKAQSDLNTGLEIINLKYPGPWNVIDGQLYKGETLINDNFEIVDLIGQLTNGNTVTVFLGDTRIATNVISDGERAIGTQVSEIVKEKVLQQGEIYLGQANVVGHTYQTAYMPLKDNDGNIVGIWYVGAPDASDRIQQLKKNIAVEITLQALLILALALLLNYLFSRPMLRRIQTAATELSSIAGGDLSGKQLPVNNNDETGLLMKSVNTLKKDLHDIIVQIQHSSGRLAEASERMALNAAQTSEASEQIAGSIQEVAAGSEHQRIQIEQANQVVGEISAEMNQAADLIERITDYSHTANEKAKSGTDIVTTAIAQMDQVQKTVGEATQVIHALEAKSREIGQIVRLITEIADQTNLLSLNAEIEAARAGEHGRGFAVVADEVRKLSVQTSKSAGDIEKLISDVQAEAQKAVLRMNEGMSDVHDGMDRVQESGHAFDEIAGTITVMSAQFQEIANIVNQVSEETRHIVQMMGGISNVTQQSSANATNVAAAVEEQTASLSEIAASASSFRQMANHLQNLIKQFKV